MRAVVVFAVLASFHKGRYFNLALYFPMGMTQNLREQANLYIKPCR